MASPSSAIGVRSRMLSTDRARPRVVAAWLLTCCALVFAMIVVGGVTRLTHSGLSITEWQPIVGTLPPLSSAEWESAFAKYQATPEYRLVNHGMSIAEFKGIFWWEYFHRLLGRLIGAAFLLPFAWLALRGAIPKGYGTRLGTIFLLGAMQGALGWYMVQSGLVDDPRVSQFRLTAHLALACAIFGAMLWIAMSLLGLRRSSSAAVDGKGPRGLAMAVVGLVFLMIVTGGFVAGIRAGFAYNTFPLMNGHLVPPEALSLSPWWMNFFYNMATVQLDHRIVALSLAVAVPLLWWRVLRATSATPRARIGAQALLGMLVVQIGLGIATLVNVVPLALAALHQAGAVVVFAFSLNLAHALRRSA